MPDTAHSSMDLPNLAHSVPVLTVLAEYGNSPFLWIKRDPTQGGVGPNLCDASYWDESFPMSEGLWRKFADWALAFEAMKLFLPDVDDRDWSWIAFHARGLHLARWLKEEVGEGYRVVYLKPCEDPNRRLDERREVLANGDLLPLAPFRGLIPEPARFCQTIVSGGQTGADRAALDFAIHHGYPHGGWAPHGRHAEDGQIPLKYQLHELADGGYRQRTKLNVEHSDGTLVLNLGELQGGTLATQGFAVKRGKPHLMIQLEGETARESAVRVVSWLDKHSIENLNVAGPRESKRPGVYGLTRQLLAAAHELAKTR